MRKLNEKNLHFGKREVDTKHNRDYTVFVNKENVSKFIFIFNNN